LATLCFKPPCSVHKYSYLLSNYLPSVAQLLKVRGKVSVRVKIRARVRIAIKIKCRVNVRVYGAELTGNRVIS